MAKRTVHQTFFGMLYGYEDGAKVKEFGHSGYGFNDINAEAWASGEELEDGNSQAVTDAIENKNIPH